MTCYPILSRSKKVINRAALRSPLARGRKAFPSPGHQTNGDHLGRPKRVRRPPVAPHSPAFPLAVDRLVCRRCRAARPGHLDPRNELRGNHPVRGTPPPVPAHGNARPAAAERRAGHASESAAQPGPEPVHPGLRRLAGEFAWCRSPLSSGVAQSHACSGTTRTRSRTSWSDWRWSPPCRWPARPPPGRRTPTGIWR